MNKQDISTIIDLHFEEMTDLEQEIARYFLQADTIHDDLSSQQFSQKLHISQAALTRFAKKMWLYGLSGIYFQIPATKGYPFRSTTGYESFDPKSLEKLYKYPRNDTRID